MPEFNQDEFNQLIMQYLAGQMGQQQNMQQGQQQPQIAAPELPKPKPKEGIEALIEALSGKGQFGISPHLSSLENILSRLEGNGQPQNTNNQFGNVSGSSFMNAQDLANKPLSNWQKAGQFFGGAFQDLAPLAGAAGGSVFGPLGMLAAPVAGFAGRQLSNYSQPYQLPQG